MSGLSFFNRPRRAIFRTEVQTYLLSMANFAQKSRGRVGWLKNNGWEEPKFCITQDARISIRPAATLPANAANWLVSRDAKQKRQPEGCLLVYRESIYL